MSPMRQGRAAGATSLGESVRVDTPVGLCYNKAPFGRMTSPDGHFQHV
jgi:hypothetical protein